MKVSGQRLVKQKLKPVNIFFKIAAVFFLSVFWISLCSQAQETEKNPLKAKQIREAIKRQLPLPPDGFDWYLSKNAVFLKPVNWNENEKSTNSQDIPVTVYAMSPEIFSEKQYFETGFTVQIINGSQKIKKIEAKKMALLYLKPFLDTHKKEEISILEQNTSGDFERTFFRYRDAPRGLKPIIVHKLILANNKTDSVHVFTFESPVDTWKDNWDKYGTQIFDKINILPNVQAH